MLKSIREKNISLENTFIFESIASTLMSVTFGMFHVEIFLKYYKLNLTYYATGHVIYAVINTLNDVFGAWFADYMTAKTGNRAALIRVGGILWAISFLTPWFRWENPNGIEQYPVASLIHFIFSMSAYDTMFSFCAIVSGSIITELNIDDTSRVRIFRLRSTCGLITGFFAAQIGQMMFDQHNLTSFRIYVCFLSIFSGIAFILFHETLAKQSDVKKSRKQTAPFNFWKQLKDFLQLKNLRYWLGMEMFLETQANFNNAYLRIFIDHFLSGSFSKTTTSFIISAIPTLCQCVKLNIFSVIQKIGIYPIYRISFQVKICAAFLCIALGPSHWMLVFLFIVFNYMATMLPTAGYGIAMSNMNEEMKVKQHRAGRMHEPSAAGMFMGINALFCKPMDSLLPIIASQRLKAAGYNDPIPPSRDVLSQAFFQLLVFPPIILGFIQLYSWSKYTLKGKYLDNIQKELQQSIDEDLEKLAGNNKAQL